MREPLATRWAALSMVGVSTLVATGQPAYFADGYHGGIYGHYPPTFTQFMVDSLRGHPDWKLNLEIEPETWDFVRTNTPEAYQAFKELAADQSANGRIEFVNPAYAQSYLWNISGESVIQQIERGITKIREHFPNAQFVTYSSEEPCFTSGLPGILKSLGFKAAVLKNPNTCWGGYTRAFGGELVNWVGPDGTALATVPRYAIETLRPGSTWETIANANSPDFIRSALAAHIEHPVGMCLQDAGWRFGPWLEHVGNFYQPAISTLWRNYFENVATQPPRQDWRLSQEDVQVSLVWGAQVLQRIARQVHQAENHIVVAEKMATLAGVERNLPWPEESFGEAWRTLLLSQHHDCWIVPYNGRLNNTWADKVARWTESTERQSSDVLSNALASMTTETAGSNYFIRVFNTVGNPRTNLVQVKLPENWRNAETEVTDCAGNQAPVQRGGNSAASAEISFVASVPAFGFSTYRLTKSAGIPGSGLVTVVETNGLVVLETDQYKMALSPKHGGTIQSLIAKALGGRELVDGANARCFNELRGYFFERGQFFSSAERPARIEILQHGPLKLAVRITGQMEAQALTQTVELTQGEPRIDFTLRIDWRDHPGIGAEFAQSGGFRREQNHKAFYDERYKLLALFPLNLPEQQIFKDAPFDVTQSSLTNTFFENWSDIKNNVILNWVDAYDSKLDLGVAMFTDHTTSYAHGTDFPLGLTVQYSGVGLWGRHYALNGATEIHYAVLPHAGNWQTAQIWNADKAWSEPLAAQVFQASLPLAVTNFSLLKIEGDGWEVPTARIQNGKVNVRLFNPSPKAGEKTLHYSAKISKAEWVQLNGQVLRELPVNKIPDNEATLAVKLPAFGIGTVRITP